MHHNIISSGSKVQVKPITPSTSTKHYETINCPPCQPNSSTNSNDPGYEQLQTAPNDDDTKKSDYDPNYEVLKSRAHSDDGYAKVLEKKRLPGDVVDSSGGYSTIPGADANHNYASILETKPSAAAAGVAPTETDHYARIAENAANTPALASPISLNSSSIANSLSMITVTTSTSNMSSMNTSQQTPVSSQYESLTGTGSETDPNYESVCYLNATTTTATGTTTSSNNSSSSNSHSRSLSNTENAYERLQTDLESDNNTQASSPHSPEMGTPSEQQLVDDYFQV